MATANKRRLATTLLKSAAALVMENSAESDTQALDLIRSATSTVQSLSTNGNGTVAQTEGIKASK